MQQWALKIMGMDGPMFLLAFDKCDNILTMNVGSGPRRVN